MRHYIVWFGVNLSLRVSHCTNIALRNDDGFKNSKTSLVWIIWINMNFRWSYKKPPPPHTSQSSNKQNKIELMPQATGEIFKRNAYECLVELHPAKRDPRTHRNKKYVYKNKFMRYKQNEMSWLNRKLKRAGTCQHLFIKRKKKVPYHWFGDVRNVCDGHTERNVSDGDDCDCYVGNIAVER